jgi:ribosomal protein S18 acetylase RimI-like enzyme
MESIPGKSQEAIERERFIDEIIAHTNEIFSLKGDHEQMPLNRDIIRRMLDLHPASLLWRTTPDKKLIGWLESLPTTRELADRFIEGEITENEMFEATPKQERAEALYIGGAVVLPEYRGQGHASRLVKEAVERIAPDPDQKIFYWGVSDSGSKAAEAISAELKRPFIARR